MTEFSPHTIDDVLVHVRSYDRERSAYPVQVTIEGGSNFNGWLNLDGLGIPSDGSAALLVAYGLDLFQRLFAPPLDDAFQQAWAASQARTRRLRVRLWLDSSDPRLHEIPWELLRYDASGGTTQPLPLATDSRVAFSRYLTSTTRHGEPVAYRPLRLLIIVSAPADLGASGAWPDLIAIDKAGELRALTTPLVPMRSAGQITYDELSRASADNLHAALDSDYDAILYFGHALYHPEFGTRLVLEDATTGTVALYDGAELVRRLQQAEKRPSLLIFVACNTAYQRSLPDYQTRETREKSVQPSMPLSLAAQIVQQAGVPAVLAMQHLVDITLARNFSSYLSEQLARHGIIDVAVNAVRQRVYQADSISWSTPVLYMRSQDGRLFAPNARLEYARAILEDPQFARWQGPEFVRMEAITAPPDQAWQLFAYRSQDAPPGNDVLEALYRALHIDEAAAPPHLVALLGPPRSGQTTILYRLTWELAGTQRQQPSPVKVLAVYVSLAGYEQQRGPARIEQMIVQHSRAMVPALETELQRLFQQRSGETRESDLLPRYLFLLDGLDAIAESRRDEASREIVELFNRLPGQRFLVSCVQESFPAHVLQPATVVLLQPLYERLVLRYLRQRTPERASLLFRRIVENRLLDIATDPLMLTLMYDRLVSTEPAVFTRNQLLQDLLDDALSQAPPRYIQGDAARQTIVTLAWEFRWRTTDTLPLHDIFMLMSQVRQERDYSLEDLYLAFRDARLLAEVGQHMVRFVYPALLSYCAALALYHRPDVQARLNDIIAMCGISRRMRWWEDTIYALAGMLDQPVVPGLLLEAAILDQSSNHSLILARALRALSMQAENRLSDQERQLLLDMCVLRLQFRREPSTERRAQIAQALGNLNHPQVVHELYRLFAGHVRVTPQGAEYDLPGVRLAAARALRSVFTRTRGPESGAQFSMPGSLLELFAAWSKGIDGQRMHQEAARAELRTALETSPTAKRFIIASPASSGSSQLPDTPTSNPQPPILEPYLLPTTFLEYTLAAFALGDLAYNIEDARLLLTALISHPPDRDGSNADAYEWDAALWAVAEAVTLFDTDGIADVLEDFFNQRTIADRPPGSSIQSIPDPRVQLTYVVGRVRIQAEPILNWLIDLLVCDPSPVVKASALQSLAWIGAANPSLGELGAIALATDWRKGGAPPVPLVLAITQALAAWDTDVLRDLGFALPDALPSSVSPGSLNAPAAVPFAVASPPDLVSSEIPPPLLHLRRTAVEALAFIGNQQTLDTLTSLVAGWPLILREAWYLSVSAIRERLKIGEGEASYAAAYRQ